MAEQSELGSKFSTLNVNAMEFVPNFGPPTAAPASAEPSANVAAPVAGADTETASSSPAKSITPTEQPSPAKSDSATAPVAAIATPTEQLTDKSPDNPGLCVQVRWCCHGGLWREREGGRAECVSLITSFRALPTHYVRVSDRQLNRQ